MKRLKAWAGAGPQTRRNALRRVAQMILFDSLFALLLFVSAGSVRWTYAWLYFGLVAGIQLVGAAILPLEVLAERGSRKENAETWDPALTRLILAASLGFYLVAGLDHRRAWTPGYAPPGHLVGMLFFILGCALVQWAMYANAFFSTVVRIQFDRGQSVCSRGPYRFVRHPGYVGMIVYHLATPLLLGSLWGLIPALAVGALLVLRTGLEDRTLKARLPGYAEYTARVRWRLLPGLW